MFGIPAPTVVGDKGFSLSDGIQPWERIECAAMGNGNAGNLWKAVKLAKNVNLGDIPANLTLGGKPIATHDVPNAFASFFSTKITTHLNNSTVSATVYNGKNKIIVQNRNFMNKTDVQECLESLKSKRCEGYDRIPVCILADACDILLDPFCELFKKIYATGLLPEQWKVSKIIPIHKKGDKSKIENYRPIANLCSGSKVFEKLILKQIHYLENKNLLDLTGKQQHGFKKQKSTATAGKLLQYLQL